MRAEIQQFLEGTLESQSIGDARRADRHTHEAGVLRFQTSLRACEPFARRGPCPTFRADETELTAISILLCSEIAEVVPLAGMHALPAFKVTFRAEHQGQPAQAIFKPEISAPGKEASSAPREVAASRLAALTGLARIAPTVDVVLSVDGGTTFSYGSLQLWIPGAVPMGTVSYDHQPRYDARFDVYRRSQQFLVEKRHAELFSWAIGDPDKWPTNLWNGQANLGNVLVDPADNLWLCDCAYSLGAWELEGGPGWAMNMDHLPGEVGPLTQHLLSEIRPSQVIRTAEPWVGGQAAWRCAARFEALRKRYCMAPFARRADSRTR
jgi:hypothetical protein